MRAAGLTQAAALAPLKPGKTRRISLTGWGLGLTISINYSEGRPINFLTDQRRTFHSTPILRAACGSTIPMRAAPGTKLVVPAYRRRHWPASSRLQQQVR